MPWITIGGRHIFIGDKGQALDHTRGVGQKKSLDEHMNHVKAVLNHTTVGVNEEKGHLNDLRALKTTQDKKYVDDALRSAGYKQSQDRTGFIHPAHPESVVRTYERRTQFSGGKMTQTSGTDIRIAPKNS